jgi:hypothetical protein
MFVLAEANKILAANEPIWVNASAIDDSDFIQWR